MLNLPHNVLLVKTPTKARNNNKGANEASQSVLVSGLTIASLRLCKSLKAFAATGSSESKIVFPEHQ